MNWLSIFSGGIDKVVDSVFNGIDELVTSDEEKLALKNELIKAKMEAEKQARIDASAYEQEITKRWVSDNEHIYTRLVRPVSFSMVLALFGSVVLTDGNIGEFTVNPSYIPVIETLLVTMVISYFGSRGIEKVSKVMKDK